MYAGMAELADAQDLGSCEEIRVGSTPTTRTKQFIIHLHALTEEESSRFGNKLPWLEKWWCSSGIILIPLRLMDIFDVFSISEIPFVTQKCGR